MILELTLQISFICFFWLWKKQSFWCQFPLLVAAPVHPKGDQSWIFIGRTDAEAEAPILWLPDAKSWLTWKRPWCWERLRAGGEVGDRGWDGWMASLTQWTWVWVNSRSWWWTGRPGVLRFMGSQKAGHDWATELNWTDSMLIIFINIKLQHFGTQCLANCQHLLDHWKSKRVLEKHLFLLYWLAKAFDCVQFSSVQSHSHVQLFATPWTAAHQPLCPSPALRVYPNSCPLSQWCHPNISSSVTHFSSCPQSIPASGYLPMSQLFAIFRVDFL